MRKAKATNTTPTPVTRQAVEAQIDALIDFLDAIDEDPDLEPSLGFSNGGYRPEDQPQEGDAFHSYWDAGHDHEDEHDGAEPDVDGEASLGWRNEGSQTGQWAGNPLVGTDLEDGVGAVRKKWPPSKTGGNVYRGTAVLGLKEPPQNPRTLTMPMANPKRRAAR